MSIFPFSKVNFRSSPWILLRAICPWLLSWYVCILPCSDAYLEVKGSCPSLCPSHSHPPQASVLTEFTYQAFSISVSLSQDLYWIYIDIKCNSCFHGLWGYKGDSVVKSACCTTIGPRVQVSITYIKSLSMTSPAPVAAGLWEGQGLTKIC